MTDFGETSLAIREHMEEVLRLLRRPSIFTKMWAIQKIKSQPFFGKLLLPENKTGTIIIRRPVPYEFSARKKND